MANPHLRANADVAKQCGIAQLLGENGDLFRIRPTPGIYRSAVRTGALNCCLATKTRLGSL